MTTTLPQATKERRPGIAQFAAKLQLQNPRWSANRCACEAKSQLTSRRMVKVATYEPLARTFAAAPDLLAALERVRKYLRSKNFDPGMRDAVAADIENAVFNATSGTV